jgi:hypothetical protein
MAEAMRQAFEAWMRDVAKVVVGSADPYLAELERDYWWVWQAAAAAEREQCAKVCEELCGGYHGASENTDMYVAQDHMLRRAAAAIRKEPA